MLTLCGRHRWAAGVLTVALAGVARADGSVAAPAPAPTPAPVATRATTAIPVDWVAIKLEADDPKVALYAKDGKRVGVGDQVMEAWSFVCLAPCGDRVDPSHAYRVMGEGLVPSVEFNLAPGSGSIGLQVRARHPASSAVTATLAVAGGVSAVGGLLLLLLDVAEHGVAGALSAVPSQKRQLNHAAGTYGDVGGGMLAGGVVLGGIALIYLATVGKTELAPAGTTTSHPHASSGPRFIPFGFTF